MKAVFRRKYIPVLFLVVLVVICNGQEENSVLSAPDTWRSEILTFPLSFAPEIEFRGFEDIRFSPGWSNPESEDFWTYHFVWYIEKGAKMTEEGLMEILQVYFDGLMEAVAKGQEDQEAMVGMDRTLCLFNKTNEGFIGKIRVFDAFFTKSNILLYVKVEESFCEKSNKQIVAFDISPKSFNHRIWKVFNQIKLVDPCFR